MRPVNLIPKEQRTASPGVRGSIVTYAFLGTLAAAVLIVSALVLSSNAINDRKEKVAVFERKAESAQTSAKALQPYGNFARLEDSRVATVKALADSRFNWERVIRALSRTIPSDVWLTSFKGTVVSDVDLEEGSAGGTGNLRGKTQAPAVELVGCAYDHEGVARMMVRMRNIDGVSEVVLGKSERPDAAAGGSADAAAAGGAGAAAAGAGASGSGGGDCRTKSSITKFEILVVLGDAQPPSPASVDPAAAAAGAPAAVAPASAGATAPTAATGAGQ